MIIGCYAMDLYCSGPGHTGPGMLQVRSQFTGQTRGEATRKARAAGWRVDHKRDVAICPQCSKLRTEAKPKKVYHAAHE